MLAGSTGAFGSLREAALATGGKVGLLLAAQRTAPSNRGREGTDRDPSIPAAFTPPTGPEGPEVPAIRPESARGATARAGSLAGPAAGRTAMRAMPGDSRHRLDTSTETQYHLGMDPTTALDRAGYRLTGPRRAVAGLIAERDGHFTAADLVAEARSRNLGIGRATVFRSLDLLIALGVVERLDLPSGDHAYVACEPAHHHHVVCSRCGRAAEINDAGLRSLIEEVGARTGYTVDTHRLELFGSCPACRAAEARS